MDQERVLFSVTFNEEFKRFDVTCMSEAYMTKQEEEEFLKGLQIAFEMALKAVERELDEKEKRDEKKKFDRSRTVQHVSCSQYPDAGNGRCIKGSNAGS